MYTLVIRGSRFLGIMFEPVRSLRGVPLCRQVKGRELRVRRHGAKLLVPQQVERRDHYLILRLGFRLVRAFTRGVGFRHLWVPRSRLRILEK